MRYDVGRFRRPMRRSTEGQLMSLISLGDGSTLTLDFTTGVLDPRLTFTRASGGTYTGNDGLVYGMDFATSSSLAIGTGSKSVTLTATAGVDRRYLVGQTVYISNGVNNMSGQVTAYNASTQVLTINATATSGSGSFTSWTVGNASPRFDYDPTTLAPRGLLIEATATNVALNSETFPTSGTGQWGYSEITANVTKIVGPDNTTNAIQFNETTNNAIHRISQGMPALAAGAASISVWAKVLNTGTPRRLFLNANAYIGAGALFDLDPAVQTGSSGSAVAVGGTAVNRAGTWVKYPNDWYRCTVVGTYATAASIFLQINRSTSTTATDDTFAGSTSNGLSLWGVQVESGSGASSYIPTGASTVQRLADECQLLDLTTMGFNASAGTIFVDMGARINTGSNRSYTFLPASGGNNQMFEGSGVAFQVFSSGSFVAQIGASTSAAQKIASAYAVNDYAVSVNGGAVATDTSGALPTSLTKLTLGGSIINTAAYQFGCIRTFKYWPTRLSNATLQSLTT